MSNRRLIIFVKAPRPGHVKTRLAETLGADAACAAYRHLVDVLLGRLGGLQGVELRFTPEDALREVRFWLRPEWTAVGQGEGDLGQRLARAFADSFIPNSEVGTGRAGEPPVPSGHGPAGTPVTPLLETAVAGTGAPVVVPSSESPPGTGESPVLPIGIDAATSEFGFRAAARRVVVIGSDCPDVGREDIQEAWAALEQHDLVLGPATDGGYWLIGLRAPAPFLFEGIEWSTTSVLRQTLDQAQRRGLSVKMLRPLSDVDTELDWRRFQVRSSS